MIIMAEKDDDGAILSDGDSATIIKDLKVKGSSDVLKTCFMKKV